MAWKLEQDILQRLKQRKLKRFWSRTVNVMMCIVVFCTTYALILPAITKETDTFCEMEEHVHTAACYPQVGDLICEFANTEEHVHSEACVPVTETDPSCGLEEVEPHTHEACALLEEQPLICALEETEGHAHSEVCQPQEQKDLVCTLEEVEGHTHSDTCQPQEHKDLICTLEEVEGHSHSDACQPQEQKDLVCTLTEVEGHAHSDACGVEEKKDLICGQEEVAGHVHSDACGVQENRDLICGLAEDENHTHGDECYSVTTSYACGLQEAEGHSHSDACFSVSTVYGCGLEEIEGHAHGDACFSVSTVYGCGKEEIEGHIHEDSCFTVSTVYGCGKEEIEGHAHGDACFVVSTVYACGLEEVQPHSHTDECYDTLYDCGLTETEGHAHSDSCYITTYGCGLEGIDHIHTEVCYVAESALICTLAESDEHTHSTECYNCPPACGLEEHKHDLECYSDPNADVESSDHWESTLPDLTGVRGADVVAIARSQLGYTESTRNYILDESEAIKGYTRYGAWYGVPYGDWCGMFASFCLRYAGVNDIPINFGVRPWIEELTALGLYYKTYDVIPTPGCLIFFDWEGDGLSDHVGIVEEVAGTDVIAIEGNSNNRVERNTYSLHDDRIAGYGLLEKSQTEEPEVVVGPNDTDAWAVLIDPSGNIMQVPEAGESKPADEGVSTYSLRRMSTSYQIAPRAGTPLDLTPYINAVTMYDSKGNVIPNGSAVTEGDMIEFKIEYTVTGQQLGVLNGETITVKSDTLEYDIPDILQVVKSDSGNIYNSTGHIVGTYVIDSNTGKITMTFTDDYVRQNANSIQIHGYISFFSTVVKIYDEDEENQNYQFTDGITLGVIIKEKNEIVGDLTIEKSKVSVDGEEIVYEIKVTSEEGTNGSVTLTDTMSEGLTFLQGGTVLDSNNQPVHGATFTPSADNSSFTMTLPEMAAGDTYTVTYRCKANIDLLAADMTVRNTATVTGKDSDGKELKDEVTVDHNFNVLEKTGTLNDDGSISWTITVNQAEADISGWILEDILTTSAGSSAYSGTVTISNSNGDVIAENVKLPYTFPNGSKDTYVITYTTKHGYDAGDTISNRAILKDNDTEVNEVSGVVIGSPIKKEGAVGTVIKDENGKYLLPITWTVTIDTSNGAIPAGEILKDTLEDWNNNDMYMTYDQLNAARSNITAALSGAGSSVSAFKVMTYKSGMGHGSNYPIDFNSLEDTNGLYDYFEVTLGSEIPKGKTVVFEYEAYGVFENNVLAGSVYTNQINISDRYNVKTTVSYEGGTVKAKKMALSYYDPKVHNGPWYWNLYHYNGTDSVTELEYEKLKDDYLAWAIELSVPPNFSGTGNIILHEDLPDGVTLRGLNLPFESSIPRVDLDGWRVLEQWDIEHGNTYYWTFTLYTAEQYLNWSYQNGQPVTITVNVTDSGDLEIIIPSIIFKTMSEYITVYKQAHPDNPDVQKIDEWYCYLHVFTQIDDDFEWTTEKTEGSKIYLHEFENRFTLEDDNGKVLDFGSQTQRIEKNETEGIIRKQATEDENNNIINYSVVLNAYGRDQIENADTLAIHDELTYPSTAAQPLRVRLVPGSVKLYEIDLASDGSYTKLRDITPNYRYLETSSEKNGTTTWIHTIDLTVPDGKPLVLEYSYKADGAKGVTHNVLNTCTISGVGEGGLNGDHRIEIDVKDATAQADTEGVMIYKVDAESDGIFLKDARFNIYIWNKDVEDEATGKKGKYIIVHHPDNGGTDFTTDVNGMIVLDGSTIKEDQFAYNTAYYIVEVESPEGYYLGPERYYFQIVNNDTVKYPSCLPEGFNGHALTSGDIIYRKNTSDTTEITVEKYWQDINGVSKTVTGDEVESISFEVWRKLDGVPNSDERYYQNPENPNDPQNLYVMTPDEDGNWRMTITGLPKATRNEDGTKGTDYLYYIKEVAVTVTNGANSYVLESDLNNEGINSGTIKLTNKQVEGYVLPETGGAGTTLYTMAGLLLMMLSLAYLVYNYVFRRREEA